MASLEEQFGIGEIAYKSARPKNFADLICLFSKRK